MSTAAERRFKRYYTGVRPHLVLLEEGRWCCLGMSHIGVGDTMANAYDSWLYYEYDT